jgi:hypothetical protein
VTDILNMDKERVRKIVTKDLNMRKSALIWRWRILMKNRNCNEKKGVLTFWKKKSKNI